MADSLLPQVTIYTDGGADPNPGTGGWAAVLIDPATGKVKELSGGEARTTNNRMELTAAIRGLETLKQRCRVHLFTDSQYLRKGITQWLPGWVLRGWRRKDGELQNEDLWRRLAELILEHEIRWDWVKGHAGNRWNERADKLAALAIQTQRAARRGSPAGESALLPPPPPPPPPDAEVFLRVSGSGGRGGWAALVRREGEETVHSGRAAGSPNQLDILGAAEALERLPPGISVAVHTASDYLRNGASVWIEGWKRRGWRNQEGKPVANADLWKRLDAALSTRRVSWPGVKDRDLPELEALGVIAREAAKG